jgi:5'-methylthioadenosine phosphorylase
MESLAEIGVFGGSGFYDFAESDIEEVAFSTPFGDPSEKIAFFTIAGRQVAFMPRHGKGHRIPPHKINYRANVWAMQHVGVSRLVSSSAVGSLRREVEPGQFVINDQFVDMTKGRADTFYDGSPVTHVSTAQPYCPEMREVAVKAAECEGIKVHRTGTIVTIQGPRFSTYAESRWFNQNGWDIVGMTQCPEAALARELALCYCGVSLVTDYDAGVAVDTLEHVEASHVADILTANVTNVKRVIKSIITMLPADRSCKCKNALQFAHL